MELEAKLIPSTRRECRSIENARTKSLEAPPNATRHTVSIVFDPPPPALSTRHSHCSAALRSSADPPRPSVLSSAHHCSLPPSMLTLLSQRASVGAAVALRGAAIMAGHAASTRAACTAAAAAAAARSRPAVSSLARPSSAVTVSSAAPRRCVARAFHTSAPRRLQLGGGPPSGNGGDPNAGAQGTWVNPANVPSGEALKKFCHDLTQMARDGKLDPVRTHDERRCRSAMTREDSVLTRVSCTARLTGDRS